MQLLRPALRFALCLLFVPIGAGAFECQSMVSESGTELVTVTTNPDAAPPLVIIAYAGYGTVAAYEVGGVFVFDDWKLLGEGAYDIDGKRFEKVIARHELTTAESVIEEVRIRVDRAYLEDHSTTGIDLTIYGENGDSDLFIAPEMISEFLSCLKPAT